MGNRCSRPRKISNASCACAECGRREWRARRPGSPVACAVWEMCSRGYWLELQRKEDTATAAVAAATTRGVDWILEWYMAQVDRAERAGCHWDVVEGLLRAALRGCAMARPRSEHAQRARMAWVRKLVDRIRAGAEAAGVRYRALWAWKSLLNWAAAGGVEVYDMLAAEGAEGTSQAVVRAAAVGDMAMLEQRLDAESEEAVTGCSPEAVNAAVAAGHLPVVELLHRYGGRCTGGAVDEAARAGHLTVLEWLTEKHATSCVPTDSTLSAAAQNGQLSVVEFLHTTTTLSGDPGMAFPTFGDRIAWQPHCAHVVRFLFKHRDRYGISDRALEGAAHSGQLSLLEFLVRKSGLQPTQACSRYAAENGHVECLQFLSQRCGLSLEPVREHLMELNDRPVPHQTGRFLALHGCALPRVDTTDLTNNQRAVEELTLPQVLVPYTQRTTIADIIGSVQALATGTEPGQPRPPMSYQRQTTAGEQRSTCTVS